MEQKFEWNKEKQELIVTQEGTGLVLGNKNVDGRFEHKTIYPKHTVRDMVKELERQLSDNDMQMEVMKKAIKNTKDKIKPVDKAFFQKFRSCASMMAVEQKKDELKTAEEQKTKLNDQLLKIQNAMKDDF